MESIIKATEDKIDKDMGIIINFLFFKYFSFSVLASNRAELEQFRVVSKPSDELVKINSKDKSLQDSNLFS